MSALGNYVHLSWQGYKNMGTYRDESNWKRQKTDIYGNKIRQSQKSNYNPQVFANYIDSIQKRTRMIQVTDLVNLEAEYNRNRLNQFNAFQRAAKTRPQDFQRLMELVVKNADLGSALEAQASSIAEILSLDENIQNVSLSKEGQRILNSMQTSSSTIKKIAKLDAEGSESYLSTLYDKVELAYGLVKLSPQQDMLSSKLQDIEKELDYIEEAVWKGWASPSFSLIKNRKSKKRSLVKVPRSVAVRITNDIIAISKTANLSIILKKIQGSFTEIMGTSLRPMVRRLAINEIQEALGGVASASSITAKQGKDIIYLDKEIMDEELDKHPIKNTVFDLYASDGDKVTFKTDYPTKNKADFILEWQGKEIGVSAKAYDLSVDNIYDKDLKKVIPNYIKLHSGTSLLMFLLGMEQSGYSPIGTHMLNVLTEHEDANLDALYANIRKNAEEALMLSLLYSSLTGDLLGKDKSTFADVLMIEDKSKQLAPNLFKVRFYDINTILSRVIQNSAQQASYVFIKPAINTITIQNTKEVSAKARITKVLLNARQIKFTVGLQIKGLMSFR